MASCLPFHPAQHIFINMCWCNAYRHLNRWLDEACLHCREADDITSPSDQWTEAAVYRACTQIASKIRFFFSKTHIYYIAFLNKNYQLCKATLKPSSCTARQTSSILSCSGGKNRAPASSRSSDQRSNAHDAPTPLHLSHAPPLSFVFHLRLHLYASAISDPNYSKP